MPADCHPHPAPAPASAAPLNTSGLRSVLAWLTRHRAVQPAEPRCLQSGRSSFPGAQRPGTSPLKRLSSPPVTPPEQEVPLLLLPTPQGSSRAAGADTRGVCARGSVPLIHTLTSLSFPKLAALKRGFSHFLPLPVLPVQQ